MSWSHEFIDGMEACKAGIPHEPGTDAYDRGYDTQYTHEQIKSEESKWTKTLPKD